MTLRLLYAALIIWCIAESSNLKGWQWYSQEVQFSDWRNIPPVQYSSNAVVANYYSGGKSKYLRQENVAEIQDFFAHGDTVTVAVDYYALYSITLPVPLPEWGPEYLANGGVLVIKLVGGQ